IIMLLDIQREEEKQLLGTSLPGAILVGVGFIALVILVLVKSGVGKVDLAKLQGAAAEASDTHEIGRLLFSEYWFPIQMVGILLLVATVGVVVLSRKTLK
ncbi:MAG: NADH-quinone oxidoreductase subunit J, partial [Verrucomicrobiota bacterium]